jgi:methylenetetrahydrofolate reductase (NADPH)
MNATVNAHANESDGLDGAELKRRIIDFARDTSTEISPHDEGLVPELARMLPAGTTVYVAHTPKASVDDVVRVASSVRAAGLKASPHIVARRIDGERTLREALRRLRDGGVDQLLLVAGDRNPPAGQFTSTLEILASGALAEHGFRTVGVAGHPEGHPAVGQEALWSALQTKQDFAERTGTRMHIVTQFSFNPQAVCAWDRQLDERGIKLPVHIGIAGPTPLPKLIKFAVQCGIGASIGALTKGMGLVGRVAGLATSPDEMLIELVRGCVRAGASHLVHPHFYAFGGVAATARWLRGVVEGEFDLEKNDEKFTVRA